MKIVIKLLKKIIKISDLTEKQEKNIFQTIRILQGINKSQ